MLFTSHYYLRYYKIYLFPKQKSNCLVRCCFLRGYFGDLGDLPPIPGVNVKVPFREKTYEKKHVAYCFLNVFVNC